MDIRPRMELGAMDMLTELEPVGGMRLPLSAADGKPPDSDS